MSDLLHHIYNNYLEYCLLYESICQTAILMLIRIVFNDIESIAHAQDALYVIRSLASVD